MTTELYPADATPFRDNNPNPVNGDAAAFGRSVTSGIDTTMGSAARGLRKTASTLRNTDAIKDNATFGEMAANTASNLDAVAEYLEGHDCERMMSEAKTTVTNNPGRSLVAAAALGFLVALAFRRSN